MRVAPTTIIAAALSSLATLSATLLVMMIAPHAFRESGLSREQRTEIASIAKDQVREMSEGAAKTAGEQGFSDRQRKEIAQTVRELLRTNPDVIQEALTEMIRKRVPGSSGAAAASPPPSPDKSALIKSNAAALFSSAHQVTIGNPDGDVTLVEFFDYNCGYCKRALSDTIELLRSDPQLKIVLKEFPILGPGSSEAAKVGIAVRMQDPDRTKYLAFHQRLLGGRTPADKTSALAIARDIGLDVTQIERDLSSDEVRASLEENMMLARAVGINGTPGYVIGNAIVPGAVGAARLKENIALARNTIRQ